MQPHFDLPIQKEIANYLTGKPYRLESADSAERFASQVQTIVDICNEPLVYEWIFATRLMGKPYAAERAENFLLWGERGWQQQTHFLFFITYKGRIVGACDIKSPDLHWAEVGYWLSAHHPGIMTNAVIALCTLGREAGYQNLFAKVKPGNVRSMGVLARAGFGDWEDIVSENQPYKQCSLRLV